MASIPYSVPPNGSAATIGPFPFSPKGMTLVNQTSRRLIVTDDRGIAFPAEAGTIVTVQPSATNYLRLQLDGVATAGEAATVYVSDVALPITSSGLAFGGTSSSGMAGWTDFSNYGVAVYVSADGPTGVISIPADVTGLVSPGMRARYVQGGATKYGIVTAVGAYAAGVTPLTLYGGTDYTTTAAAISTFSISTEKAPYGFPLSPAKWTETMSDAGNRLIAAPAPATWLNPGSLFLDFPIGAWDTYYECVVLGSMVPAPGLGQIILKTTLSTANNTESDSSMTCDSEPSFVDNGSGIQISYSATRRKTYVDAVKTRRYLNTNLNSSAGNGNVYLWGAGGAPSIIRAVSAYL